MAMNDEETVALIVGGHTFGKAHGAHGADDIGPEPEGAPTEQQGLGWRNTSGTGVGADAVTSGLEGAWTTNPIQWDDNFLENLYRYDWELTQSPAGAYQWKPENPEAEGTVPDAHDPSKRHAPMMLTTDLALKVDPVYGEITKRFLEHPDQLADAFAKAWYKLLHRDMGAVSRYLGPWVPEPQLWQDPVPAVDHQLIDENDVAALKRKLLDSGLSVSQLVYTARNAGHEITVPFAPGRTDASQEQTDVESFEVLEPRADGFRNYVRPGEKLAPETLLVDRAYMLDLTAPEMTVLVGGMRALNANHGQSALGVLTDRPETLTNDFFVNLLDMGTEWKVSESDENVYEGRDRATGELRWTATAVDLVFGSSSQLRALAEVYGQDDAKEKFVRDFVAAWDKVMNLDRFDLPDHR
jgi:catalase (peroxidase I)